MMLALLSILLIGAVEGAPCMQDSFGKQTLNCQTNDIQVAQVISLTVTNDCFAAGDTTDFSGTFGILRTATSTRYDIGLRFSSDGDTNHDGALTGQCAIFTPDPHIAGWDDDGDGCGDMAGDSFKTYDFSFTNVPCVDDDHNGRLDLPYCSSWRTPGSCNTVCGSAIDAIPCNPSKCGCNNTFSIPIVVPGAIFINLFTLGFDGNPIATTDDFPFTSTATFAAGTPSTPLDASFTMQTQPASDGHREYGRLRDGTYTLTSSAPAGSSWRRNNVVCTSSMATGSSITTSTVAGTATLGLRLAETITCNFTYQLVGGNITTILVTQNSAGVVQASTQLFTFTPTVSAGGTALGGSYTLQTDPATNDRRKFTSLSAGTYVFQGDLPSTWSKQQTTCTSSIDSTSFSVSNFVATLNLRSGESITCTFVYRRLVSPTLDVVKTVDPTSKVEPGGAVTYTFTFQSNTEFHVDSWSDTQCGIASTQTPTPGAFPLSGFSCTNSPLRCVANGVLTCTVPSGASVVSVNPYGGFTIPNGQTVTCTLAAFVCGDADDVLTNVFLANGTANGFPPVTDSDDATTTLTNLAPSISATADWQYTNCAISGKTSSLTAALTVTLTVSNFNSAADTLAINSFSMVQNGVTSNCKTSQVTSIPSNGQYSCVFEFLNTGGNVSASVSISETTDSPAFSFSQSWSLAFTQAGTTLT